MSSLPAETPKIGRGLAGPGRKKGTPNKVTAILKDCILRAAEEAGGGGKDGIVNYLRTQAIENPGPFLGLLGKVLPTQLGDEDNGAITVVIRKFSYADEDAQVLPAAQVLEPATMKLINPPE
jgi:hypothetical protein